MKKILLFALVVYVAYYFGTQHQNLTDRANGCGPDNKIPGAAAKAAEGPPSRPAALVFGKGGDLSLEACRREVSSFCANRQGLKGKTDCLSKIPEALSDQCSAALNED